MNRIGPVRAGSVLIASLLVAPLHAQQVLLSAHGPKAGDSLGAAISVGPDLNGDGFAEIAVGATNLHNGSTTPGGALILSGRDFSVLQPVYGAQSGSAAGAALAWSGDVDGDGVADLAVGAPWYTGIGRYSGEVRLHSGSTWKVIRTLQGANFGGNFGYALADLGDVNGDGVDDLLIGAPNDNTNGPGAGLVQICSGSDGSTIRTIYGDARSEYGTSVANVGDIDGDGVNDFAVGAPYADGPHAYDAVGRVRVHSGATGAVLIQVDGPEGRCYCTACPYGGYYYSGDLLGMATGPAGDFDGDGVPDFWVASYWGYSTCQHGAAYLEVISGATGATLQKLNSKSFNQTRASAIGDIDGDGRTDFIGNDSLTAIYLLSSARGGVIWETDAPRYSDVGSAFAPAGDHDGDGRPDFLVGNDADSVGGAYTGTIELLAANDLWLDVSWTRFPSANWPIELRANLGPPGGPAALFLTSVNGAPRFDLLSLATFDATGSALLASASVPPGLSGTKVTFRALAINAAGHIVDSIDEEIDFR